MVFNPLSLLRTRQGIFSHRFLMTFAGFAGYRDERKVPHNQFPSFLFRRVIQVHTDWKHTSPEEVGNSDAMKKIVENNQEILLIRTTALWSRSMEVAYEIRCHPGVLKAEPGVTATSPFSSHFRAVAISSPPVFM